MTTTTYTPEYDYTALLAAPILLVYGVLGTVLVAVQRVIGVAVDWAVGP